MKPNIHPENYRTVLFFDSSAETGWLIRSCAPTNQTRQWTDGNTYPVFYVTRHRHRTQPTQQTARHHKEGRASQFNQRFVRHGVCV